MKILAAHRAGLNTVILPKRNEKDLEDVPEEVRDAMAFILVDRIDEAIEAALIPAHAEIHAPDSDLRDQILNQTEIGLSPVSASSSSLEYSQRCLAMSSSKNDNLVGAGKEVPDPYMRESSRRT